MDSFGLLIGFIVLVFIGTKANQINQRIQREQKIRQHEPEWGKDLCDTLVERKISVGMTKEMILLALGRPSAVDQKEVTAKGLTRERWVYGALEKARVIFISKMGL